MSIVVLIAVGAFIAWRGYTYVSEASSRSVCEQRICKAVNEELCSIGYREINSVSLLELSLFQDMPQEVPFHGVVDHNANNPSLPQAEFRGTYDFAKDVLKIQIKCQGDKQRTVIKDYTNRSDLLRRTEFAQPPKPTAAPTRQPKGESQRHDAEGN